MKLQYITRKHISHVEIQKDEDCSLGISITDITKERNRPIIKNIKNGSLAHKSHSLVEGDVILSVDGRDTQDLSKKEIKRLLKDSGNLLDLKVEYITREACFGYCRIYCAQRLFLTLRKESGSFGFILRRNDLKRTGASEYPIISNIKRGGPADKEGSMMEGDRLLEVDNQSLSWLSLSDATTFLQEKEEAVFLIEYNVGIVNISKRKEIQMEIDCPDSNFGMTLSTDQNSKMSITSIHQGSLAQRCGAFHVGDEIVSINDIETKSLSPSRANEILRRFKKNPGKLTFIHSTENRILTISSDRGGSFKKKTSTCAPSTELETLSTVPSEIIHVPPNSPVPSYKFRESAFFKYVSNPKSYDDCQLKTMSILRSINNNVTNLMKNISEQANGVENDNTISSQFTSTIKHSDTMNNIEAQFKPLCILTKELTIHMVQNATQIGDNLKNTSSQKTFLKGTSNSSQENSDFMLDLIDNLNEIASRDCAPAMVIETLLASISRMLPSCFECSKKCYSALFAVRKILLLFSLNNSMRKETVLIRKVIERLNQITFPCEHCQKYFSSNNDENQFGECRMTNLSIHQINTPNLQLNGSISLRTGGVGASLTSSENIPSRTIGQDSHCDASITSNHSIGFDLNQRTALYRLTKIQSEETDEDMPNRRISTGDYPFMTQYSNSKMQSSASLTTVPNIRSRKGTSSQNLCDAFRNTNEVDLSSSRRNSNEIDRPSVRPKANVLRSLIPTSHASSNINPKNISTNSFDFDVRNTKNFNTRSCCCCDHNCTSNINVQENAVKTHTETHDVVLKADSKGSFGLVLGYNSLSIDERNRVPIITAIKPKSPAEKNGLLKKGDRLLAMNGLNTVGISVHELETMKREIFSYDEIVLRVEFNVNNVEIKWGTFSILLEANCKLGLVMDEPDNPSLVKGIVKGSLAHRSGEVFPKDKLVTLTALREDTLDVQNWRKSKNKVYKLVIKREAGDQTPDDSCGDSSDTAFDPMSLVRTGSHFNIQRTSIRTVQGQDGRDRLVLEHEFILYRDPLTWDFGFLFGENPRTGKAYITDVRPEGPADNCNIIKKNDRIMKVNGVLIDGRTENSIMNLLMETDDHVKLITRRVLSYK